MIFSISSTILLLAGLSTALPTSNIDKRQTRASIIFPNNVVKLYEHSPDVVTPQDGWGEASRVGNGLSGVNSLVSFQTFAEDAGKNCNLRFAAPDIQFGSKTFTLFSFVPNNGISFDPKKANWNSKTGYRDQALATHTYALNGPDIVYSFKCPSGGKWLNYELVPSNSETNMQWYQPNGEGIYLEVQSPSPSTPKPTTGKPIEITMADQAQIFEANIASGSGSIQYGDVDLSETGLQTTTIVAFIMPATNYANRQCRLRFTNPTSATGSKAMALFEFIPNDGLAIFRSDIAKWNAKTGYRNRQLAIVQVGDNNKSIYTFPCPAPGKGLNYELTPSNGETRVQWNFAGTPKGGLVLEVL